MPFGLRSSRPSIGDKRSELTRKLIRDGCGLLAAPVRTPQWIRVLYVANAALAVTNVALALVLHNWTAACGWFVAAMYAVAQAVRGRL